jgi:hypothetical protein
MRGTSSIRRRCRITAIPEAAMIDDTTSDTAISAMVDIAGTSGQHLNPSQRAELDSLLAQGLIKKMAAADRSEPAQYALTPKGQKILDDRGVGANES